MSASNQALANRIEPSGGPARLGLRGGIDIKHFDVVGTGHHTDEQVVGFYTTGDRMKFWCKRGTVRGGLWGWLFGGAFLFVPVISHVVVRGYLASLMISAIEVAVVVGELSALGAALYGSGIRLPCDNRAQQ